MSFFYGSVYHCVRFSDLFQPDDSVSRNSQFIIWVVGFGVNLDPCFMGRWLYCVPQAGELAMETGCTARKSTGC